MLLWVIQGFFVSSVFVFFYVWEHDECSFARGTTLDVRVSCLIGLDLNVFQTAPGAYGRMEPSRGENGREGEAIMMKESSKSVCLLFLASLSKEEIKLLLQRCSSSKLLYDKCITNVTFAFKLIF